MNDANTRRSRAAVLPVLVGLLAAPAAFAQQHTLRSPDGRTEVRVELQDKLRYSVWRGGAALVQPSPISITLSEPRSPAAPLRVLRARQRTVRSAVRPVLRIKRKEIPERFNELRLTLTGGLVLTLRAYNDGVAYRWSSSQPGEFLVHDEQVTFALDPQDTVYFAEEESFFLHNDALPIYN